MSTLMCCAPMLFDRDNAAIHSRKWASKSCVVSSFLGSLAQASWRDKKSTGALSVYLLSVLFEDSWLRGMDAPLLWHKMLSALGDADEEAVCNRPACLDPFHKLFELVAKPQFCPDVATMDWTWDEVRALQRLLGGPQTHECSRPSELASPIKSPLSARVSVSAAWSVVGSVKKQEEREAVSVPILPTAKGALLLLEFCQYLVCKTLPFVATVRA